MVGDYTHDTIGVGERCDEVIEESKVLKGVESLPACTLGCSGIMHSNTFSSHCDLA